MSDDFNLPAFTGATFDSRLVKPGMLFVAVKGENCDGRKFIPSAIEKGAAGILDGYDELNKAAQTYRRSLRATVIGITGSAGKTTTKELVKAFLSRIGKVYATEGNFNNHLGLPITILNCPKDADFLVLEMGTNHPGEIAHLCQIAEPDCGIITGIGTAHLEFFGNQEGIAKEKGTLLNRVKTFGVVSSSCMCLNELRKCGCNNLREVDPNLEWMKDALSLRLPGSHNLSNASLAFALASHFGVTKDDVFKAMENFSLPGSRWRLVKKEEVTFIDDTYNANPEAMKAALKTLSSLPGGRKVAILGDMFELGPNSESLHRDVFSYAKSLSLPLVLAVGKTSMKCECDYSFESVEELKIKLSNFLNPGDIVLLKASHSMHLGNLIE